MIVLNKPKMIRQSEISRGPKIIILQILIFLAIFFISSIAESAILSFAMVPDLMREVNEAGIQIGSPEYYEFSRNYVMPESIMILQLFLTVIATVFTIIYCRFIERRPLKSMGMQRKFFTPYLRGMVIGIGMLTIDVLVNVWFGAISFSGANSNLNIGVFFLFLGGFFVQGMSEEFLLRGYFMNSIGSKHSMVLAVFISSIFFGLLHVFNPGASFLAISNIILYGLFMGLYFLYTENIWELSAIHTMWNFAQGNIFGISVSGTGSGETIFYTTMDESQGLVNGGSFGIEGGLITTAVLLVAIGITFLLIYKQQVDNQE